LLADDADTAARTPSMAGLALATATASPGDALALVVASERLPRRAPPAAIVIILLRFFI
jgi:hypothetical protein